MPDGRHHNMNPKVIIGSAYEPKFFERRTATTYSAKQPATTHDGERLQSAFMADHARRDRQAVTRRSNAVAMGLGAITVALLFGAWAAQQLGG